MEGLVRLEFVAGERLGFEVLGSKYLFIVLEKVNKLGEECNNNTTGVLNLGECKKVDKNLSND